MSDTTLTQEQEQAKDTEPRRVQFICWRKARVLRDLSRKEIEEIVCEYEFATDDELRGFWRGVNEALGWTALVSAPTREELFQAVRTGVDTMPAPTEAPAES